MEIVQNAAYSYAEKAVSLACAPEEVELGNRITYTIIVDRSQ